VRADVHVHILIDSLTMGGAEVLLADLARGAPAHGLELSVGYLHSTEPAAAPRLRSAGLEPEPVGAGSLFDPRTFPLVRRHLERVRPAVVHTHLQYSDLLGGAAARSLGLPAVCTVHVLDERATPRDRARAGLVALARRRCHDRVIAVSDHIRHAHLASGADRPEHVVTVHNGIAARPEPGAGARVRAELGLARDDIVVAVVAVLRNRKGHDLAVTAIEEVRRAHPHVRLLIVGDGPARREVGSLMQRLGDAAVLTGHRDDVMAVLDATDVLLHPSRADAFPTVLVEGLAAGVPIVATAVGGIPEIVEDGRSGLLVPPSLTGEAFGAPLARLVAQPAVRRAFADHGRQRFAAEFTAERWAARLRGVYEQVVITARPSRQARRPHPSA
jgi:glycosyltransferase involved in cell wall biosynthesis